MKPSVYIHIGVGKTGTSAIQRLLKDSSETLERSQILYKVNHELSNGNIKAAGQPNWFEDQVIKCIEINPRFNKYIFSNEVIHKTMDCFFRDVSNYRNDLDFHILLVLKNPLDHISSSYQQAVKGGNWSDGFDDYVNSINYKSSALVKAAEVIAKLDEMNIKYTLYNHSIVKYNIWKELANTMGICDFLNEENSSPKIINRSMSSSELQLLVLLRSILGKQEVIKISNSLIKTLPHIRSDKLPLSQDSIERIKDAMNTSIEYINSRLNKDNYLNFSYAPTTSKAISNGLTDEQVNVIKAEILRSLVDSNSLKTIRNIAFKYESNEPITKSEAISLMEVYQKLSPSKRAGHKKMKGWLKEEN